MSSDPANLAAEGAAALAKQAYEEAIELYTKAIAGIPNSVDYHIKRSTAYQRSQNHPAALSDAEIAVALAKRKGHREQLANAQLRRGISLYCMQRYGDADACFRWSQKTSNLDKSVGFWQSKLDADVKNLAEDDLKREVTIAEIPEVEVPKSLPAKNVLEYKWKSGQPLGAGDKRKDQLDDQLSGKIPPKEAAAAPVPQGVTTPADKIRHEWYQTNAAVNVTLFVKGVPKDETTVELDERSLSITFPLPNGSEYAFTLDPLSFPIDASASTYKILGTKVEFNLVKVEQGRKWAGLESAEPVGTSSTTTSSAPPAPRVDKPPAYPTSSKSGPKNWDKVVNDLAASSKAKKTDQKGTSSNAGTTTTSNSTVDKDEIDYADLDEDEFSNDPVNGFFKKLYKDADPDTRRAMMKSYQESNGTALSTNWSEVKKGKVETSPPEGMEAKKWGA